MLHFFKNCVYTGRRYFNIVDIFTGDFMASNSQGKKNEKGKLAASRKKKKNANLARLCTEMNGLAADAVDKEIIKRFKTMIDTTDEDITKTSLGLILKDPKSVDLNTFHEGLQPYVKHYLFMSKRNKKSK